MDRYHFHEFFEINFIVSGDVRFFVAEHIYQARSGDILVFNHTDLHRSVSPPDTRYERIVLYFAPDEVDGLSSTRTSLLDCFINRQPDFSHCLHLTEEQSKEILQILERAAINQNSDKYGSDVYRKISLAEILLRVNELYSSAPTTYLPDEPEMKKVLPILIFIQEHLHEDLSLERLSKTFYLSKYHLSHIFKRATGFSPNEYIIYRRVMKARELLKRRDLSVQSVGEAVGFNNISHFIRTFKSLVGTSPKQYSLGAQNKHF